jgi:hypothetical protein
LIEPVNLCRLRSREAANTVLKMKIWMYWSGSQIYFYIILNKNWKIYWFKQSFTGLGPEHRCSSWGLQIKCNDMSTCRMLFQWINTIKFQLSVVSETLATFLDKSWTHLCHKYFIRSELFNELHVPDFLSYCPIIGQNWVESRVKFTYM